jgi:hypothetical protein
MATDLEQVMNEDKELDPRVGPSVPCVETTGSTAKKSPDAVTAAERPECDDFAPPGFMGHWRDWHRGHGCRLDDLKRFVATPMNDPPVTRTIPPDEICERIETLRNNIDAIMDLVPAREPWCLLERLDRDLRQLKQDLGFPNAEFERYRSV